MLNKAAIYILFPIVFYFLFFIILSYPAIFHFNTHFFCDAGDGLQNIWNIWWINKAVTELGTHPWYTNFLHYPHGVPLYGQTLNPFNGFFSILLLKLFTLTQTHNIIIVFSFVAGGLGAFLLSHCLTRYYWGSLIAGYIFTFSNYHFAHAQGHMQLVSLEWIPFFLLFFLLMMRQPTISNSLFSALFLFFVILCDYYYFMYCVFAGFLVVLIYMWQKKSLLLLTNKQYLFPISVFIAAVLSTSGILVFNLVQLNTNDPLLGSHNALLYSTDLISPFIPGGHWKFAELTKFYWSSLPGNIHETSVYLGLSVIILFFYSFWALKKQRTVEITAFYIIFIFFFILSLGPKISIFGTYYDIKMPYSLLEFTFPFLKISGCPVRMMIMVYLAAGVILSATFKSIGSKYPTKKTILISALISFLIFIEYLPKPIPLTNIPSPSYVMILKQLDNDHGIVDLSKNSKTKKLYFQTIHEKPMAFGYVSRLPTSVFEKNKVLMEKIKSVDIQQVFQNYNIGVIVGGEPGKERIYFLGRDGFEKVEQM